MYTALLHTHSVLRWVALILLLVAIFNALASKGKNYEKKDKMINLFTMVSLHMQLLLGIIMLFFSGKVAYVSGWMKVSLYRFFGLEHLLLMILAIALITIGRRKAENETIAAKKHKKIIIFYTIGLILILAGIPWPFREALGGAWF